MAENLLIDRPRTYLSVVRFSSLYAIFLDLRTDLVPSPDNVTRFVRRGRINVLRNRTIIPGLHYRDR